MSLESSRMINELNKNFTMVESLQYQRNIMPNQQIGGAGMDSFYDNIPEALK